MKVFPTFPPKKDERVLEIKEDKRDMIVIVVNEA